MEKEKLKRVYRGAEIEVTKILSTDVIQTSNLAYEENDGSNMPSDGWT
mgnify:CR=1 FL=1